MKEINTKQPLVSVIMPTYNHAQFIGEAIDSVLNQTYKNFELIIIDNYSEDNTGKIVASYKDDRVKYLKFKNNGVIAASRNYGIRHSRGEYIAFLDSDDMWLPSKLDKQICQFKNKEIAAVGTEALLIRGSLISRKPFNRKNRYTDYTYRDFLFHNYASCSSTIVRKDILLNLKGFDECKDFICIEDWELWLRVTQMGNFRILGEQLIVYRIPSDKKWKAAEISKRCFYVLKKHSHLTGITKDDINEVKANINLSIALNLLRITDSESQKYFIKALKHSANFKTRLKIYIWYFFSILPPKLLKVIFFLFYHFRSLLYKKI